MRKIVINACFGGFTLSTEASRRIGVQPHSDIARDNPELVKVVEEMGFAASGPCAHLEIVEIPDDVKWHIHEYDGVEHVAEDHRTWGTYDG